MVSNRAHSGLVVDGLDLPISDPDLAYGSGLTAAGEGDGWYAIEGRNPLLRGQGVAHTRLFLYRPGVALVIVDRLRSATVTPTRATCSCTPTSSSATATRPGSRSTRPGFAGAVYDAPGDNPATRTQARGQHHPLQGLSSPDFREFVPRWTLAFADSGSTEVRALTIALDQTALRATGAARRATTTVELTNAAGDESMLEVVRDRRRLTVSAG